MTVPVDTPQRKDSRTHQRKGESSMVRRIPNASGNIRVHDSVMMALSVLLVIAADVVDDDDDDSSWVMFGGGISILRGEIAV